MSNSIKLCPTHFSRGAKQFAGGAPLVTGLPLYGTLGPLVTPMHPSIYTGPIRFHWHDILLRKNKFLKRFEKQ